MNQDTVKIMEVALQKNPIRNNPGFSNWHTKKSGCFSSDTVVNLQLPKPFKLNLTVTDAQSNVLPNSVVGTGFSNLHDLYAFGGLTWDGSSSVQSSWGSVFSTNGTFQLYFYPESKLTLTYCQLQCTSYTQCGEGGVTSPPMPVLNDSSYQLCLPINFGAVKSTPSTCVDAVLAAADKAAADKAAADKAAADKAAAAKAASLQKTTIMCVKGKLTKKVTAVKPICPKGYKKK